MAAYLRHFLGEAGLENQVKANEAGIDPHGQWRGIRKLLPRCASVNSGRSSPKRSTANGSTAGLPPDLPPADLSEELVEQLLNQKA